MRPGAEAFVRASRGARTFPGVPEENYWFRRHQAAYHLAMRALAHRATGGTVLEVGSGEGYGAALLERAGPVVAVELDPVAVSWTRSAHRDTTVVRADACRLPFRSGSVDGIVALQLLEHLYCPKELVAAAAELLTPDGILVVSTPNRETSAPDGDEINPFHVHEYTAAELIGLLRTAFGRVRLAGVHPGPRLDLLGRAAGGSLHRRLARTPFDELPAWLRTGVRAVRAGDFRLRGPHGSLDLVAVAEQPLGPR